MARTAVAEKPARRTKSAATSPTKTRRTAAPASTPAKRSTRSAPVEQKPAPAVRKAATSTKTAPAKTTRAPRDISKPAAKPAAVTAATRRGANASKLNAVQKGTAKKATESAGREVDPVTGFIPGTDSHIIATELLKGGETRTAIIERLRGKLDLETRNGTQKSVANVLASTFAKMMQRGFTVEATYKLNPPTPASKRAATRKANAAKK